MHYLILMKDINSV